MALTSTADIRRIIGLDGAGLPILSLYVQIPVDPADRDALDARVRSLLSDVRELSQDKAMDHDARMSLRGDLERIEQAFREERRLGARSVAVFSCSGRGIFEEVELPRTVRERAVVDENAFVRPALAVLDELRRCCVVLIDSALTQVWELYQGELREVRKVRDPSLRNPDFARWNKEHSTHNRARELEKQHFRRTVQVLDELFHATPYDVLAVGGQAHEVPGFVEFLPQRLRERVAGTFAVDRSTTSGGEIKEQAAAILEQYERDEERRLVARVLEKAAAGGFAAVGLKDCQRAADVAAVDLLLVQEDGADELEELVQTVIDEGGSIEHVVSDTELKEHLVAAELRFPLPPKS
jgi:peptide subunit release factor 1 (eRF1)